MRRRTLLASGTSILTAAMAGCSTLNSSGSLKLSVGKASAARFSMTAVTDAELPAKLLYTIDSSDENVRLFDRILDGGTTVEATHPPLPSIQYLCYDDAVYELSQTITDRTPATRYSVRVDIVEGSVDDSETIRFADLPAVDRQAFAEKGLASGETIGIGTGFVYTDAERKQSALVPESDYSVITWEDGSKAKWAVDDASETTINSHRYTAERVAATGEYGQRIREEFAFELSELSEAQREIVDTAIEKSTYRVAPEKTPPAEFISLARRFREHDHPTPFGQYREQDLNGTYLVGFDGSIYWTVLMVRDVSLLSETQQ
ncbi:hypothetical protein [Haladaptatus sp. DFWS20]|uniref:hypothetical protein n=1 Tax=Haladaptatus sp. DFWS20 TaxID=3403467 RepID=UPI003EBB2F7C